MQSFLNIIDLASGRQIRAAEFGFYAERPSFCTDNTIRFYRGETAYLFSLETGSLSTDTGGSCTKQPENNEPRIYLNYKSEPVNKIAYVELIYGDGAGIRVLGRFMGGTGTLGERPFTSDYCKAVFFGYPSEDGIN